MPRRKTKKIKKPRNFKSISIQEQRKQKQKQEQEIVFRAPDQNKAVYDKKGQLKYYDVSDSYDASISEEEDEDEKVQDKQNEDVQQKNKDFENFEEIAHKYVDQEMGQRGKYHIYYDIEKLYDCLLNQTSMVNGENHNKFYIMQLLESNNIPKHYLFFCRWGRVGVPGQQMSMKTNSLNHGIKEYDSKFYEKTVKGNYVALARKYDVNEDKQKTQQDQYEESKLDKDLKELIKLIFDMKMMDKQMEEQGYDSVKCPLGQLAPEIIQRGYKILNQISETLSNAKITRKQLKLDLQIYSSEFFSYIPHNFGFKQAPVINTEEMIKEKLELLQSLEQINKAASIMEDQGKNNFFDACYQKLNCSIRSVKKNEKTYQLLTDSIHNTHGQTHNNFTLEIQDMYEIDKESDNKNFVDYGNNNYLFHGSRMSNFVGIISQGLRIAPPEAPVTGYMFGKGVYFADMVSKSANYCCASSTNPTGLLLICQVSLGKSQERLHADYHASSLDVGCQSTKGVGKNQPLQFEEFEGCKLPIGGIKKFDIQSDLLYNEYIVYDTKQIKLRYLVKLKFNYKL